VNIGVKRSSDLFNNQMPVNAAVAQNQRGVVPAG